MRFFLHFIARPLAAELDTLVDQINETTVDAFKATIKRAIHRYLGVA